MKTDITTLRTELARLQRRVERSKPAHTPKGYSLTAAQRLEVGNLLASVSNVLVCAEVAAERAERGRAQTLRDLDQVSEAWAKGDNSPSTLNALRRGDKVWIDRDGKLVPGQVSTAIPHNRTNTVDDGELTHTAVVVNLRLVCPSRGVEVDGCTRFHVRRNGRVSETHGWRLFV